MATWKDRGNETWNTLGGTVKGVGNVLENLVGYSFKTGKATGGIVGAGGGLINWVAKTTVGVANNAVSLVNGIMNSRIGGPVVALGVVFVAVSSAWSWFRGRKVSAQEDRIDNLEQRLADLKAARVQSSRAAGVINPADGEFVARLGRTVENPASRA